VPESGHSIAWEQPQIFNEKVLVLASGSYDSAARGGTVH